jgi:hypoxanthine phosphoribosyltransferase
VGEVANFQEDSQQEPPRFANEAERECAKVLDFYGVPWEYEPHTFVTRKNRKLRRLRERYPEVRVKLFYKRDIERLAQRYRLDLAS